MIENANNLKTKYTLSPKDLQNIIGCGKNNVYYLIEVASQTNLFIVKKIGKKYYIPSEPFWKWYNSTEEIK